MPEGRSHSAHRAGSAEDQQSKHERADSGEQPAPDRASERGGGSRATVSEVGRTGGVGQTKQRLASSWCGPLEQSRNSAVTPTTQLLEASGKRTWREPGFLSPRHHEHSDQRTGRDYPGGEHPPWRRQNFPAGKPGGAAEHQSGNPNRRGCPASPASHPKRTRQSGERLLGSHCRHPP